MKPLVSVITPTWQRHDVLINRCMPSVKAQTYPDVEHVIVSDGPDEKLDELMREQAAARRRTDPLLTWGFLETHDDQRHWGVPGRLKGIQMAQGDLIAYLDDDDEYLPRHVELLAAALEAEPDVMWAYSMMSVFNQEGDPTIIGAPAPGPCAIGTPMVMHRRELLDTATWGQSDALEDWQLIERWEQAGVLRRFISSITINVWPSLYYANTGS